MPEKCKYEQEYFDFTSGKNETYKCEEDAVEGGLCIFHHKTYWTEHEDEVRKKFMEKVEDAVNNKKPLLCIGYNLPEVDLSEKKFEVPVYFQYAVFYEKVNFCKAEFNEVDFSFAEFNGEANFSNVKFLCEAPFYNTKFYSKANFFGVTFLSKVHFDSAEFVEEAYFNEAKFLNEVSFSEAKFYGEAHFAGTEFSKEIGFYETNFSSMLDFREAKFASGAYFTRAKFSEVDFFKAKFSSLVTFNETKFLGKALFNYSTFLDAASFVNSYFLPYALEKCLKPCNYISFRYANFERQEKVVFDGCNMERVSFLNTNIERVKFRNVKWRNFKIYDEKLFLLKHLEKERKKFANECEEKLKKVLDVVNGKEKDEEVKKEIYYSLELKYPELKEIERLERKKRNEEEEERLRKLKNTFEKEAKIKIENTLKSQRIDFSEVYLDEDLTLENVLAVYRALRENYDYYLKYDESGKFFINEMKLKKRFSNFIERVVMSVYELLCLYGESYTRTIVWILVTIPLFALARLLFEASSLVLNMNSLMDSLKISTAAFFQLYYDNDWLTIIERLISIPILGSFYIALRRKLERRIRH